ncbi:MAG: arabinan endo-1,5-alpha-L-arabinosidase [Victivallales bacterium]|nr:arabinan endo-1,5-alpha-L-arabinosidase [Victivallales bacterium]
MTRDCRGMVKVVTAISCVVCCLLVFGRVFAADGGRDPVIGRWSWFSGDTVVLGPGGKVNGGKATTWRRVGTRGRRYEIRWHNGTFVDRLTLSRDGTRLTGKNQRGTTVSGTRLGTNEGGQEAPVPVDSSLGIIRSDRAARVIPAPVRAVGGCHDPSRIIRADGRYWIFSTAPNLNLRWSTDLEHWRWGDRAFSYDAGAPPWMVEYMRGASKKRKGKWNLWAPDIIKSGDQYLLFYSRNCPAKGGEHSVCGVATSPTIRDAKWVDRGPVLDVLLGKAHYRVIDPAPVFDQQGRLWLAVGSFGSPDGEGWENGGIRVFELNPATGKLKRPKDKGIRIAGSWIEAPYIFHHDRHYYLFFNEGKCCDGRDSTYFIRVGRSRRITGPYVDRDGVDLRKQGGTLLMGIDRRLRPKAPNSLLGREIGPGHVGIFVDQKNRHILTYHYYDGNTKNGEATLGMRTIRWRKDGWPEVQ